METTKIVSSMQLDKHIFRLAATQRQQLMMTDVAAAEEVKDSTLDCMVSTASKAFSESRPCRLHRLMSLVLPSVMVGLI